MKTPSILRYIRDVFENALPDADIDREYFDLLEQSDEPGNRVSGRYNGDGFMPDTDTRDTEPQTEETETNAGYIYTSRGVRVSFADINHISNQTRRSDVQYTQPGYANTLDLTMHTPLRENASSHVLDTRS